ncbi:hypothetical protein F511_41398 [Dorcoceras hygrometricum]|uniref:Uncharacterized protein n=1 Tax=Dorcoceras hygrometricum TaxID=472368 RepID=A0A2Z7BDB0_9LAMI|nr:hypothetical protein F511_41398 [Dorcoceras hygrometricum]
MGCPGQARTKPRIKIKPVAIICRRSSQDGGRTAAAAANKFCGSIHAHGQPPISATICAIGSAKIVLGSGRGSRKHHAREQQPVGDYWRNDLRTTAAYIGQPRNNLHGVMANLPAVMRDKHTSRAISRDYRLAAHAIARSYLRRRTRRRPDTASRGPTTIAAPKSQFFGHAHRIMIKSCGVPSEVQARIHEAEDSMQAQHLLIEALVDEKDSLLQTIHGLQEANNAPAPFDDDWEEEPEEEPEEEEIEDIPLGEGEIDDE